MAVSPDVEALIQIAEEQLALGKKVIVVLADQKEHYPISTIDRQRSGSTDLLVFTVVHGEYALPTSRLIGVLFRDDD